VQIFTLKTIFACLSIFLYNFISIHVNSILFIWVFVIDLSQNCNEDLPFRGGNSRLFDILWSRQLQEKSERRGVWEEAIACEEPSKHRAAFWSVCGLVNSVASCYVYWRYTGYEWHSGYIQYTYRGFYINQQERRVWSQLANTSANKNTSMLIYRILYSKPVLKLIADWLKIA